MHGHVDPLENTLGPPIGSVLPRVPSAQDFEEHITTDLETRYGLTDSALTSDHLLAERTIPIVADQDDISVNKNASERVASPPMSNLGNSKGWFWNFFSGIRQECTKDLEKVSQVIIEEGAMLHIPLINHDYIVSDYEGEISSIIACALALMEDFPPSGEALSEDTLKGESCSQYYGGCGGPASCCFCASTPFVLDVVRPRLIIFLPLVVVRSGMPKSFSLGNKTCLAKILGIYQVTIRQTTSGKEVKHDLTSINVKWTILCSLESIGHVESLQYTWDKQLETWVKSSLVVPKNVFPTIISPKEYKKRFRKFMDTHFLTVSDHWCLQRSSNPCKLCGIGGDYSSETCEA
ncbi:hypothetical protein Ancab_036592 [Ancistrocladus abbreviatus]